MSDTPAPRHVDNVAPFSAAAIRADRLPKVSDPGAVSVSCANAGDHAMIYDLLVASGMAPTREDFLASQDDPYYEPSDRLLARTANGAAGHLQVSRRVMHFAGVPLPVAQLKSLAVLPEYRSAGCAAQLLREAERLMREDGTLIALVQTRAPERFRQSGWADCSQRRIVRAGAREIRAQLATQPPSRGVRRMLSTRIWRHVEVRQLMQLYNRAVTDAAGPLERTEDYWQWLISRQAYDQILVAIEGTDTLEFGDQAPQIVGYTITRDEQVVELVAADQQEDIVRQLLVRACREAIERDHHVLRIHIPPANLLGRLLPPDSRIAEGDSSSEHVMAKVLDPSALVGRLFPLLVERARAADIPRPCELLWEVDGVLQSFVLSRRSARLSVEGSGRVDVRSSAAELAALLLGAEDVEAARASGRIKTRNKNVGSILSALFPRIAWWRPTLDDLEI